ncbi:hypothetical protein [Amycolatopsis sp. WGS_07]
MDDRLTGPPGGYHLAMKLRLPGARPAAPALRRGALSTKDG